MKNIGARTVLYFSRFSKAILVIKRYRVSGSSCEKNYVSSCEMKCLEIRLFHIYPLYAAVLGMGCCNVLLFVYHPNISAHTSYHTL
jgi:hypothetical protein